MPANAFTAIIGAQIKANSPVGKIAAAIMIAVLVGLIFVATEISLAGYGILGAIAVMPVIALALFYPRVWLYGVALLGIAYFRGSSQGVSAVDVLSGLVLAGSLFAWIVWRVAVNKKRLIYNSIDWVLLILFLLIPFNLIIALLNGVELLDWLREYIRFSMVLFYFPVREYFREKKYLLRFLIIYAFVVLALDFFQFYAYYKAAFSNLVYAYQLGSSVRINQVIFTTASMFGIVFALYAPKRWLRLTLIVFSALTFSALLVSFSRAFWLIFMAEFILLFFYISYQQKKRYLLTSFVISVILTASAFVLFGDKVVFVYKLVEKRLTSSTKGTKDISLQSRLNEWEKAIFHIAENPLGGNGFAKEFQFYNPITQSTKHTNFIHNAYIFLTYRLGIPMALCFFAVMLYFLFIGEQISRKSPDDFLKKLQLAELPVF